VWRWNPADSTELLRQFTLKPSSETLGKNGTYSGGPGKRKSYDLCFLGESGVQLSIPFPENALNLVLSSRDSVETLSGRNLSRKYKRLSIPG
jgi:hypothetical protein